MPKETVWFCHCKTSNPESRGRCSDCGSLKPRDAKLFKVDSEGTANPQVVSSRPYGFLRMLTTLYWLGGLLSLLAIPAAFAATPPPGAYFLALASALSALVCFGLAEAGKVLLVIEERTRK